jgi:hypothetical protein
MDLAGRLVDGAKAKKKRRKSPKKEKMEASQ